MYSEHIVNLNILHVKYFLHQISKLRQTALERSCRCLGGKQKRPFFRTAVSTL